MCPHWNLEYFRHFLLADFWDVYESRHNFTEALKVSLCVLLADQLFHSHEVHFSLSVILWTVLSRVRHNAYNIGNSETAMQNKINPIRSELQQNNIVNGKKLWFTENLWKVKESWKRRGLQLILLTRLSTTKRHTEKRKNNARFHLDRWSTSWLMTIRFISISNIDKLL